MSAPTVTRATVRVPRPRRPARLSASRTRATTTFTDHESSRDQLRRTWSGVVHLGQTVADAAPVTGRAVVVLLAVAACLVVGLRYGWSELVYASVLGGSIVIAAAAFTVGRTRISVELGLAQGRVVVGERALGQVVITSIAPRRMLPMVVEMPVGRALAAFDVPSLSPGEDHEELFAVPTARRGVVPVGPVRSVRGDPLGMLRRDVVWADRQDLFVHPRTIALQGASPGFIKDLEGHPTPELSTSDVSFHALRAYVPGDDRRYVHWRTSARTGTLMVRQFEESRRSHVVVALSTSPADYATDDEFELAVSACGSLGLQALREGRDLSVLTSSEQLRAGAGRRLMDDLSVVERRRGDRPMAVLGRRTAEQGTSASLVVLVCGAPPELAVLRSAARAFPVDVRVVVLRCATTDPTDLDGATPDRSAVRPFGPRLSLVTVDVLEDLPRLLRRAVAR